MTTPTIQQSLPMGRNPTHRLYRVVGEGKSAIWTLDRGRLAKPRWQGLQWVVAENLSQNVR